MYRSVATSCRIRSIGKSGSSASGPIGSCVPGCSGGGGGSGRSATRLYQVVGISSSEQDDLWVRGVEVMGGKVPNASRRALTAPR